MKIYFERSGGLAGMRIVATLDTDTLPSDEVHQIQAMVDNAKFFDLPSKSPKPKKGADYFQYKITVETEGRKHTVETNDVAIKPTLRPFVDFLVKKARKKQTKNQELDNIHYSFLLIVGNIKTDNADTTNRDKRNKLADADKMAILRLCHNYLPLQQL